MQIWRIFIAISIAFTAPSAMAGPELKNFKLMCGDLFDSFRVDERTLEQQRQLLHEAGLPVAKVEKAEKDLYIVEHLEVLGSDIVLDFLKYGSQPELKDLVRFYLFILAKSPYTIQNLKFSNVGRRADGTWVIADWVLTPRDNRIDLRTEISISIQDSIVEAYRQLDGQRASITSLYMTQLIRRFESEGLLSRGQVEHIRWVMAK